MGLRVQSFRLSAVEHADYFARLPDLPPPMTWQQFHDRARLGWRLVRAIELCSRSVVMIDDVVGVISATTHRRASWWEFPPPAIAEVVLTIEAPERGYLLHYEAHLSPDRSVLVYKTIPIYYPT